VRLKTDPEGQRFFEGIGYTVRTLGIAYTGTRVLARSAYGLGSVVYDAMSPTKNMKNQKQKRRLRGTPPGSSELAGPQGRGPAVPRATMGADTLLGLARSIRRTLVKVSTNISLSTGATGGYNE